MASYLKINGIENVWISNELDTFVNGQIFNIVRGRNRSCLLLVCVKCAYMCVNVCIWHRSIIVVNAMQCVCCECMYQNWYGRVVRVLAR